MTALWQQRIAGSLKPIEFYPYSLDLIPVAGMMDINQSVGSVENGLRTTLTVIEGIRNAPFGLPGAVRQGIEDVRFHVVVGLSLIDGFYRRGGTQKQPGSDVSGLNAAVRSHLLAANRTRPTWHAWLTQAHVEKMPGDPVLPRLGPQGSAFGTDDSTSTVDAIKPTSTNTYLAIAFIAAAFVTYKALVK